MVSLRSCVLILRVKSLKSREFGCPEVVGRGWLRRDGVLIVAHHLLCG